MASKSTKTSLNLFAQFVSIVLNPVLMVFVMILGLSMRFSIPYLTVMLIMGPFILTTLGYVAYHRYIIKDADLDLTQLKTRRYLGITSFAGLMVSFAISHYLYPELDIIFYRVGGIILISGLISQKWKISFHSIGFTSLAFAYYRLFGFESLALLVLLPLLYWSRLILKKHTIKQLIAGSILSMIILI